MQILRAPLNKLFKKDSKQNWSTECQRALEEMKKVFTSKKDIVICDASNLCLGAAILNKERYGQVKEIAHATTSLSPAETVKSNKKKET